MFQTLTSRKELGRVSLSWQKALSRQSVKTLRCNYGVFMLQYCDWHQQTPSPNQLKTLENFFQGQHFLKTPLFCYCLYRKLFFPPFLFDIFCVWHLFMQSYFPSNSRLMGNITKTGLITQILCQSTHATYIWHYYAIALESGAELIGFNCNCSPDSLHMWLNED